MKKFLSSALCMIMSVSAFAQDSVYDAGPQEPYFGARFSLDISSPAGSELSKGYLGNGAGFSVGAIYNIPLYMNLYFEPGLNVFYNTFDSDITVSQSPANESVIDGSIRNFGFRVPLAFGYHFDIDQDIKVSVFTGPQFNYGLSLKQHYNLGDDYESESLYGHGWNHLDMQWIFGAGVSYDHYYLALTGGIGVTKLGTELTDKIKRNTFSISLGYNF